MNTLEILNKLITTTPVQIAERAKLGEHLENKAREFTNSTAFIANLDSSNRQLVADWLEASE